MSTSLLYHSQGVAGFQHVRYAYEGANIIRRIVRIRFRCDTCGSGDVTATRLRTRRIQAGLNGRKKFYLEADVHSVYCLKCKIRGIERFNFLSHPKARITSSLERTVIELRAHMSISAIAGYYGLDWRVVKDSEKRYLAKKYKRIRLKDVRVIGIDELFVTRRKGVEKYITVVRDLGSGAVLFVGRGKGADTLEDFGRRLKRSKCEIVGIAMDMSKAYVSWVEKTLPEAEIVFDHFHVVKMMNDKLDGIRRRVARNIDEEQRKLLKNQRFLFLRNVEDLEPDARLLLDNLRKVFKELGDASMMKEALRSIYCMAKNDFQAEAAFKNWCSMARETGTDELVSMADTVEKHMKGITAFWRTGGLSNASMEGFNNKIRWLMRQAYGYRDDEYFHLKIFDLPQLENEARL
jgi:transposase